MKKVFLDTNILMDFIDHRDLPFLTSEEFLLQLK